jgi:exodeoxyribonuclease V alpha subunit
MQAKALYHSQTEQVLAPIDRHFAGLMARLSGDASEVKLAAAMASYYCRQGHICVDLEQYEHESPPAAMVAELGLEHWPASSSLLNQLRRSPVVGKPGDFKPLVLDQGGRLYLHRYWKYETALAQAIARLAADPAPVVDPQRLKTGLARLFPQARAQEVNWQLVAAFAATRRRLCIISGGPGTGKTRTAVVLLALLLEQSLAMRVAVCAPTGKAAARLQEAVKNAKATLPCEPEIKDRLPAEASTIHRLLGYIPDSAFFRHDAENPLPFDTVVVDEASMVDLALMAKLLAAVPRSGRLILLGDKDQLASVEAGAVLADLCNGGEPRRFSEPFLNELKTITGLGPASAPGVGRTSLLSDCIVELRRNYRFGEQSGIYQLSQAVNQGDAEQAIEVLGTVAAGILPAVEPGILPGGLGFRRPMDVAISGASPGGRMPPSTAGRVPAATGLAWRPLPAPGALKQALKPHVLSRYNAYLQSADAGQALQAFGGFRVLCALRNGPYGVENLNRLVEEILAEAGLIQTDAQFYAGQPVMVVRNDYNLKLFNGDIGILRASNDNESRACFAGPDQTIRDFLPLRLPEHETAYAMTVHKSQGSEFERVLLILPSEDSPLLTRELVYTGLTRASQEVELWSNAEILATAIRRKISRRSGLREALWET